MICNIAANPNIRHIVLCARESARCLPGESLLALKEDGVNDTKQIIGANAPTSYRYSIPWEPIERLRNQIASIMNLLCQAGERDTDMPCLCAIQLGQRKCGVEGSPILDQSAFAGDRQALAKLLGESVKRREDA